MSKKKSEEEKISNVPPFGLRMLPELKERIAVSAADRGRSMNAEIVARLESSFVVEDSDDSDRDKVWQEIQKRDARIRQIEELSHEKETYLRNALEEYKYISAEQKRQISLLEELSRYESTMLYDQLFSYSTFIRQVLEKSGYIPEDLADLAARQLKATDKIIATLEVEEEIARRQKNEKPND